MTPGFFSSQTVGGSTISEAGAFQAQMYALAHDIKGPLNRVQGLLHIAKRVKSIDEMQQYLEMALRANSNASDHISELLENHKAGVESINLKDTINEIWSELAEYHDDKNIKMICSDHTTGAHLTRKAIFKSVIQNLLENAIKYRSEERPLLVMVTLRDSDTGIEISISDNGIGIRKEDLDKIFSRNFQENRNNNGHGMGLYLVKQHVATIGGAIKVQSDFGTGTTFKINL